MRKAEWIALFISLAGVAAAFLVAVRVFEAVPHVEDEMAYVWQAKVLAHGQMTAPTPPEPQSMYVPFVVDANGHRSAKYPPGWPMVLALGMLLGIRTWVNPLLGGLAVWLTFRLGQKICNSLTGLLAALLTVTSPFFLIISGSLDSNSWSLVLSIIFVLAWLDTFHLGNREDLNSKEAYPSLADGFRGRFEPGPAGDHPAPDRPGGCPAIFYAWPGAFMARKCRGPGGMSWRSERLRCWSGRSSWPGNLR